MSLHDLPPAERAELEAAIEADRIRFERWRSIHRRRPYTEPSEFDGCRTVEDDRLDDPRHGQAESINRGY
jgi:hypothetical protein